MKRRWVWLGLGVVLGACGSGDNSLAGSIGRTHGLGFAEVQVRQVANAYTVAYLKGAETVAKLSYVPEGPITPGATLTLRFGNQGNAGLSRATSDGLQFPAAKDGTITFDVDPSGVAVGGVVGGRFGLMFNSGDTLTGSFSGALSRASL